MQLGQRLTAHKLHHPYIPKGKETQPTTNIFPPGMLQMLKDFILTRQALIDAGEVGIEEGVATEEEVATAIITTTTTTTATLKMYKRNYILQLSSNANYKAGKTESIANYYSPAFLEDPWKNL
jgi:hypothetical protein